MREIMSTELADRLAAGEPMEGVGIRDAAARAGWRAVARGRNTCRVHI